MSSTTWSTSLLSTKFEGDFREPIIEFALPILGQVGVLGIDLMFWVRMLSICIISMSINFFGAFLALKMIRGKNGSVPSHLFSYGILVPFLTVLPFHLIDVLDIQNPVLRLTLISNPALLVFRCFATLHNTLPPFAMEDTLSFFWYFAATVEFRMDPKTKDRIPTTVSDVLNKTRSIGIKFFQCVALFTLMKPSNYKMFPHREINGPFDVFFWGNLLNNYMMGALTMTVFDFGTSLLGVFASILSGYSTATVNNYPLTRSASPSDFWGRRWNSLVAGGLKRGIYKPTLILGFPRPLSALGTFAASGLLHEFFLFATSHAPNERDENFHILGKHLLFFLWNAVVLVLEGLLHGNKVLAWMHKTLPQPVCTALIFMTVLPIVHFFTDQFIAVGFYSGFSVGYPAIVLLNSTNASM